MCMSIQAQVFVPTCSNVMSGAFVGDKPKSISTTLTHLIEPASYSETNISVTLDIYSATIQYIKYCSTPAGEVPAYLALFCNWTSVVSPRKRNGNVDV